MAPKKMKFEVYCDDAVAAPVASVPPKQPQVKSSLSSLSRRELQALAKRQGIKANLKSSAIIRELMKHGVSGNGKSALQDIENIDPQKMGNRANRQTKTKPVLQKNSKQSENLVSSSEKAKQAAQMAFEREKERRMKKLMESHPAVQVQPEVKVEKVLPMKHSQKDSSTQTPQPPASVRVDNVRKSVAQFVVFDAVYAGVQRAQSEISQENCARSNSEGITTDRIKEFLYKVEEGLARQEELKEKLRSIRESQKQFQLEHSSRSWVACTPFKRCSKTPSSAKTLPAQLGTSEKENVTPGCKVPVRGSSLYYSDRKPSGRTPLMGISQRGAPTPRSSFRVKRI